MNPLLTGLGALGSAGLGVGLFAMAWSDAGDTLRGWGTERLWFGAGMFVYPAFAVFALLLAAVILQRRAGIGFASADLTKWLLVVGIAAVVAVPGAFAAGQVFAGALASNGYRRCETPYNSRSFRWDEWVRDGAVCGTRPK